MSLDCHDRNGSAGTVLAPSRFPSPRPSPQGRGSILRRLLARTCAGFAGRPPAMLKSPTGCSLSPRERVRVRGNGMRFEPELRNIAEMDDLLDSSGASGGFPRRL